MGYKLKIQMIIIVKEVNFIIFYIILLKFFFNKNSQKSDC